jgi:hypothetical protein
MPGVFMRKRGLGVKLQIRPVSQALPHFEVIQVEHNVMLNLLGVDWDETKVAAAQRLLQKAIEIDSSAADWFDLKYTILQRLRFRLICIGTCQAMRPRSFIALSYCCPDETWSKSSVCSGHSPKHFQLSRHMSNALIDELWPGEGMWIDSLCIEQDDEKEKAVAIAAMDLVYRNARAIIVALEDIELDNNMASAIQEFEEHGATKLSDSSLQHLTNAFGTIFSSRWFTRAWCDHEFLVSSGCIFLIGVNPDSPLTCKTLRLEGAVLSEIGTTATRYRASQVKPSDSQAELDSIFPLANWRHMMQTTRKIDADILSAVHKTPTTRHNGSYMHTFSRVFSLGSTFVRDKSSIALNAMLSGLSWKLAPPDSIEESHRQLFVVAVACGDPTALATTGRVASGMSWQRLPVGGDEIRNDSMLQLPSTTIEISIVENILRLKFIEIGCLSNFRSPSFSSRVRAQWVVRNRKKLRGESWDWITQLDQYEEDQKSQLYVTMEAFHVEALECALDMGSEWCAKTSEDLDSLAPSSLHIYAIDPAVEEGMRVGDRVTTLRACVKDEDIIGDGFPKGFLHPLLTFLEKLVVVGLGMGTEVKEDPSFWSYKKPRILNCVSFPEGVIGVVPVNSCSDLTLAVPSAISNDDFSWMSRVWMLEKAEHGRFKCIERTRLAGKHSFRSLSCKELEIISVLNDLI